MDKYLTGNPILFWGWNEELDFEIMRGQMDRMKEQGVGAVMPHARIGIRTEYFGEKWFDLMDRTIAYARKIGLKVWFYDEKGWPSGFGGGALLKDNPFPVTYLEILQSDSFDGQALASFALINGKYERMRENRGKGTYRNIYRRCNHSYLDLLNPKATQRFIDHTYEEYYRRYRSEFNQTVVGIFTDEPQYYRWATPFTDLLESEFFTKYGYDYKDYLIGLFEDIPGCEKFRYDYYCLLSELYTRNYIRKLYEWCDKRGIVLSGHSVEEMNFSGQIACSGGVMPFYEYEHIPGIDWLGNVCCTDISAKQCTSVAKQLGKPYTMVEIDAVTGWSVGPKRLKQLYDFLAVDGISVVCQSIYQYTLSGEGKRDYPIDFSEMLPWGGNAYVLNNYFKAMGEFLVSTNEEVRTLVLHPLRSGYLHFKKSDPAAADSVLGAFLCLVQKLDAERVAYHFGDEEILKKYASVQGKKLIVGSCCYDFIVIPQMDTISKDVYELLRQFQANGGMIFGENGCPQRIDGRIADTDITVCSDMKILYECAEYSFTGTDGTAVFDIKSTLRKDRDGNIYLFAVNLSDEKSYTMQLQGQGFKTLVGIDLVGKTETVCNAESIDFEPCRSYLFRLEKKALPLPVVKKYSAEKIEEWKLAATENILVLDRACLSENSAAYSQEQDINDIRLLLYRKRFDGKIRLRFSFVCEDVAADLRLIAEKDAFAGLFINGTPCTARAEKWRDPCFYAYAISDLVRKGVNTVELERKYFQRQELYDVLDDPSKMESEKNSVYYDSYIENIYISGSFIVTGGSIECVNKDFYRYTGVRILKALPAKVSTGSLSLQGFPFFSGKLVLQKEIDYADGDLVLQIEGNVPCTEVWLNGCKTGVVTECGKADLTSYARQGKNVLELIVCSGNRNLFGPFHLQNEPDYVGPFHYSIASSQEGYCAGWLLTDLRLDKATVMKE